MIDQALLCLATTIYMESAHEPQQAQIAVGYVLYRRADFKRMCVMKCVNHISLVGMG